ncbi:hypothetical protein NDU88_000738 [Pleurodeles waltl]|uniref:Uncharacterized protein n=1 Tax=Pleurodeles waltl TaxID=8319 RepID=A0AAV7TFN6_PLEWA|nr:hypothetical protein NDU88_000738 [Pleurodeles waltl]
MGKPDKHQDKLVFDKLHALRTVEVGASCKPSPDKGRSDLPEALDFRDLLEEVCNSLKSVDSKIDILMNKLDCRGNCLDKHEECLAQLEQRISEMEDGMTIRTEQLLHLQKVLAVIKAKMRTWRNAPDATKLESWDFLSLPL